MNKLLLIIIFFITSGSLYSQKEIKKHTDIKYISPTDSGIFYVQGKGLKLSEFQEQEYLSKISEKSKKFLEEIKKLNKNKYNNLLAEYYFKSFKYPYYDRDEKELKRSQAIYELEIEIEALALKYKNSKSSDKPKLKEELKANISELFELKEKERAEEVANLEYKLQELKNSIEIRKKNKSEIVNRRLNEVTDEDKYLEWD